MKKVSDRRERLAARNEERKEKEEKWKHGLKQEKGKKQNPKDAWKRKVECMTTCKGNMHFITTCINFCISRCVEFLSPAVWAVYHCHIFHFNQRKGTIQKTLNSWRHLWVWLCPTWPIENLANNKQLHLARTTHPTLLHCIILIGFCLSFMGKDTRCPLWTLELWERRIFQFFFLGFF